MSAGTVQKFDRTPRRLMGSSQFDPHRFPRKMRECFLHLPVEDEGNIGIQLFLKLIKLLLPMFPSTGLKHRQHEDILPGVMGKSIEHSRPLDPRAGRRRIFITQIFADGNHT